MPQHPKVLVGFKRYCLCLVGCAIGLTAGCVEEPPRRPTRPIVPTEISEESTSTPPRSSPETNVSSGQAQEVQTLEMHAFDAERAKWSMVGIATHNEGVLGYGVVVQKSSTGFDVITADHVLQDLPQVIVQAWYQDANGQRLQPHSSVTIMHRAPNKDLAWLRVREPASQVAPATLGKTKDLAGQSVWSYQVEEHRAVFHAFRVEQRVLAQRPGGPEPVSYWKLSNRVEPGLSGGGLLDAEGNWVGIASGNNQNRAHYVDEIEISRFLKSLGLD